MPPIRAAELAEQKIAIIARLITKRSELAQRQGVIGEIILVGVTLDSVAGSSFVLRLDSGAVAQAKRNRLNADLLLRTIRELGFSDFEKFGAAVLRTLGATIATVTPHAGDQGIDFYGELSVGALLGRPTAFFNIAHDTRLLFAGQAKHYPNRSIGPDTVRELVGALSLARTKTFSKVNFELFEGMELRPFSPVLCLLFTTGELTSGAVQLAERAGIVARSGRQLAVFFGGSGSRDACFRRRIILRPRDVQGLVRKPSKGAFLFGPKRTARSYADRAICWLIRRTWLAGHVPLHAATTRPAFMAAIQYWYALSEGGFGCRNGESRAERLLLAHFRISASGARQTFPSSEPPLTPPTPASP